MENLVLDDNVGAIITAQDHSMNYRKLTFRANYVEAGRKFISCNIDLYNVVSGRLAIGGGAFYQMRSCATGRQPDHIIGKPYHYMFDTFA